MAAPPPGGIICIVAPRTCGPSQFDQPLIPIVVFGDDCPTSNRRFAVLITGQSTEVVCNGTREWHSLTVEEGATLTQSQIGDNTGPESNLLFITTVEDITVKTGGTIDVSGKGYRGSQMASQGIHYPDDRTTAFPGSPSYMSDPNWRWFTQADGLGPGWGVGFDHGGLGPDSGNCRGEGYGGGGAHGGRGGGPVLSSNLSNAALPSPQFRQRPTYGDPAAPVTVGSGGGASVIHRRGSALQDCAVGQSDGAAGGGAIRLKGRKIIVTTDQGSGIFANGLDGPGGGAGGSIWIEVQEAFGGAASVSVAGGTAIQNRGEVGTAPAGGDIPNIGGGKLEAKGGNAAAGHGAGGGGGRIKLNFFEAPSGTGTGTGTETGTGTGTTGGPPPAAAVWKVVDTLPTQGGGPAIENLRSVELDSIPFTGFTLSGSTLTFNTLPTGKHRLTFLVTVRSSVTCTPPNNILTNLAELFQDATSRGQSQASLSVNCRDIVLQGDVRSGGNISGEGKRLETPLGILEAVGDINGLTGVKNLPGYRIGNDSVLFWDASNPVKNKQLEKNLKRLEGERAKPWNVSSFSGGNLFLDTNQLSPDQACTIPAGCSPPGDGQVWRVPGSLNISAGQLTVKGRGTIIVPGDLTLRGSLGYQGLNDSIGFIVRGNVIFAPGGAAPQRIAGGYFTPQTIFFNETGPGAAASTQVIEVKGSLVADLFNFTGRDGGNPSSATYRIKLEYDNRVSTFPPPGFELFLGPRSGERAP